MSLSDVITIQQINGLNLRRTLFHRMSMCSFTPSALLFCLLACLRVLLFLCACLCLLTQFLCLFACVFFSLFLCLLLFTQLQVSFWIQTRETIQKLWDRECNLFSSYTFMHVTRICFMQYAACGYSATSGVCWYLCNAHGICFVLCGGAAGEEEAWRAQVQWSVHRNTVPWHQLRQHAGCE